MTKNRMDFNTLEVLVQNASSKKYTSIQKRGRPFGVIYTRVSSQEQAQNNGSLEVQLKYCREYANREGITIKEYFGGTYESAKTDGRKEFSRMLSYVRSDQDITYIIVLNYDRFSRTGPAAAQLSNDLRKIGIIVKSITQDVDTSTPGGRLQENLMHVLNHYDNDSKSHRTSTNMKEVLLKGYWPYGTPLGYRNLKPKHRAVDHQYIITEEGKWIQKAYQWKIEGKHTNKEICEQLKLRGVAITEKNFNYLLSNPFYIGYVTGKLVAGVLIKGHHPPLVDLETFSKANALIKSAAVAHIPKKQKHDELPLKVFASDAQTGALFTGFQQKGIWYYNARGKESRCCVNAQFLNNEFEKLLKQFEYKKQHEEKLKILIEDKLRKRLEGQLAENIQIKKRLTEVENQLEILEEKYVLDKINDEVYQKFASKYKTERDALQSELSKSLFDSSNLEKAVKKCLNMALQLATTWRLGDFNTKQKLQRLVFPEGIRYDKENKTVQTPLINEIFALIPLQKRVSDEKKKGNLSKSCLQSHSVTASGFKPETF